MDRRAGQCAQGDQEERQRKVEVHRGGGDAVNLHAAEDGRCRQENIRQDRHRFGAEEAVCMDVAVFRLILIHAVFSTFRITKRSSSSSPKVLTGLGMAA